MANNVKPIPEGYGTVTPYLTVGDAETLLDFLTRAFGARVQHRSLDSDGRLTHAEIQIGTSKLMIGQAREPWKPMPTQLYLYVEDCDAVYRSALEAGAKSIMAPADMFYGDRHGGVTDGEGNHWWIATHIEDVSEEEIQSGRWRRNTRRGPCAVPLPGQLLKPKLRNASV